jgi:hypothetical protein
MQEGLDKRADKNNEPSGSMERAGEWGLYYQMSIYQQFKEDRKLRCRCLSSGMLRLIALMMEAVSISQTSVNF